jgi:gliding motility-associated-like protein
MKIPNVRFTQYQWTKTLSVLFWLHLTLFSTETLAQDPMSRSLPVIHLIDVQRFCPDIPLEIAPDSITEGEAPFSFEWQTEGAIVSTDSTLTVVPNDTVQYTLTIVDAQGKMAHDTLLLLPHIRIDASFEVSHWEGCSPIEIVFTSNYLAFQHVAWMNWEFGDGDAIQQLASAVHTYTRDGFFAPSLSIADNHGCIWRDTLEIDIRVFPTPRASYQVKEQRLYLPETSLQVENTSSGADQFVWSFNGALPFQGFEPFIEFPQDTENSYELELTAINAFGCMDKAIKSIEVVQAIELYLPNAFTPDGDGVNDTWTVQGLGIDAFHISIEIYDVWGTVVFQSNSPAAVWDAGYLSQQGRVPGGQYNYRVLARDAERGIGHLFEGHVFVLY